MRQWLRAERDRKVRDILCAQGYVLDYWLVYRRDYLTPVRLRAAARGSSRRLHQERMARFPARRFPA